MRNYKLNSNEKIRMYNDQMARRFVGGRWVAFSKCSTPELDSEDDLDNNGFNSDDVKEDTKGRKYIEVDADAYGFVK